MYSIHYSPNKFVVGLGNRLDDRKLAEIVMTSQPLIKNILES
jgi:hypothetical protein